jgi:hypothetical protein
MGLARAVSAGLPSHTIIETPEFVKMKKDKTDVEIAKKYTSLGDISDSGKIFTDLVKSKTPSYSSKVDRQAIKGFANFLVDIKLTPKPFDTSKFVYEASP